MSTVSEAELRERMTKEPWFGQWTTGNTSAVRGLLRKASATAGIQIRMLQVKGDVHSEYINVELPVLSALIGSMFKDQTDFVDCIAVATDSAVTFKQVALTGLKAELSINAGVRTRNGHKTKMYVVIASAPECFHEKIKEIVSAHVNEPHVTLSYSSRQGFKNLTTQDNSPASVAPTLHRKLNDYEDVNEALTISFRTSAQALAKAAPSYPAGTILEVEGAEKAVLNGCYERANNGRNRRDHDILYRKLNTYEDVFFSYQGNKWEALERVEDSSSDDDAVAYDRSGAVGKRSSTYVCAYHPQKSASIPPTSGWFVDKKPSNMKITYIS
eukprot:m.276424 g.276424  ORF g.276424 m.276424 type:complete len:328 (-) comp123852_c0_seq1:228-1211(-)